MPTKILASNNVESRILNIRGKKVIIDRDLAELYGVKTKHLNRQVRRNIKRFPPEFMFRLNAYEKHQLVPNWHRFGRLKHSSSLPYAFTEHGVAMLASVLNSDTAVKISIHIVKTFIRLREFILNHTELSRKISKLEARVGKHDKEIRSVIEAIRELVSIPEKPKREIGFHANSANSPPKKKEP